jgi:threonine/homoserine/homoserine lactone efflux protein
MLSFFQSAMLLAAPPVTEAANLSAVTAPIIDLLNTIFGIAIPLVGAIGAIYCIFLGVKLAKAEEQQEREKAKTALKNAIIGFVLIFVLVVALRIGLPIMENWASANS